MKVIKYKYLSAVVNRGTEENPEYENVFVGKTMPYTEDALEAAQREAYNGEHTVEEVSMTAEAVRAERDRLLAATDWTQVLDAPISAESRVEMRVYRQALRNIPQQPGFPAAVEWPVMPEIVPAEPDPVDEAFDVLTGEEAT